MPSYSHEPGSFVPTTVTQNLKPAIELISTVLNTKTTGIFSLTEFVNGSVWYPDPTLDSTTGSAPTQRQVYRKVVSCGALPNAAGTLTVVHGITVTATTSFVRIYGTANDLSTAFIPLPYASPVLADNIELWLDAANINIKVGKDQSAFTVVDIIVEFIKS